MRVLSYSPSCEAYVECGQARTVYDLSADIVSMQVDRHCDGASTFSITLQNKGWKYNGLFTPMDRIVLYCTKLERYKLLSGFITDCDVFSIYQSDIHIKGKCSLYKVQQLYWDPGLWESQNLLFETRNTNDEWQGFQQTIVDLLVKVGGWSPDGIAIGSMPKEALDFAREMYQANLDSSNQLKSMTDEFYQILQTHGPKITASSAAVSGGAPLDSSSMSGEVRAALVGCSADRVKVVQAAYECIGTPYIWGGEVVGQGLDCSGLVQYAYRKVGIELPHQSESMMQCAHEIHSVAEAQPGDALWYPGHIAIYVGAGRIVHAYQGGSANVWGNPGGPAAETEVWGTFVNSLRWLQV